MTLRRFAAALAAFALAPTVAISHPLDGLTGAEMLRVTEILRAAGAANDQTRYPLIELLEPPKAEVLAWSDGDPEPRRALVHLLNQAGFRAAVVDITGGTVEAVGPATGQPLVLFEEFTGAMNAALDHPEMIAGLTRRGLTPTDVFCLPLTAGNYLTPEYEGTRLMKVPCYLNPTGSNYYAKPIEGLFAVVDLIRGEATAVVDEGVVPVPEDDWGYTPDEVAARQPLRPASNPVDLTQAGSPGYAITGSRIEWDIWRFRLRVDKRPGIVLSNIDVRDSERWRSVLYQAHLSEVFVPYMDPSAGWYFRHLHGQRQIRLRPVPQPVEGRDRLPRPRHLPAGARQRRPGQTAGYSGCNLHIRTLHRRSSVAPFRGLRPGRSHLRAGRGPAGHRAGGANRLGRREL